MAVPDHVNQNLTDSDTDANDSVTCSSALHNSTNPRRRDDLISAVDFDDEIIHGMTASYTEISFNTQSSEPDDSILEDNLVSGQELDAAVGNIDSKERCEDFLNGYRDNKSEEFVNERPKNLPLNGGPDTVTPSSENESQSQHKALCYLNQLNGTVMQEGDMVLFVAEDLENKIKLSSPVGKKDDIVPVADSGNTTWGNTPWLYRQSLFNQIPVLDAGILNDLEVEVGKIATSVDSLTENLAEILHSVSAITVDCLETYRDVVCKTCDAVDLNIKSTYQLMAKCEELSKSMKPIYKLSEHILFQNCKDLSMNKNSSSLVLFDDEDIERGLMMMDFYSSKDLSNFGLIKEIKHFLDLFENATN